MRHEAGHYGAANPTGTTEEEGPAREVEMPEGTMPQSSACRYPEVAQALQGWLDSQQQFTDERDLAAAIGITLKKLALVRDGRGLPRGQEGQRFYETTGLECFSPKEWARREGQHKKKKRQYLRAYYQDHRKEQLAQQKARLEQSPELQEQKRAYLHNYNQEQLRRMTPEELAQLQESVRKGLTIWRPERGQEVKIITTILRDWEVACPLCGAIFGSKAEPGTLNKHLPIHKLDAASFRLRLGLNKKSRLCSARYSLAMSKLKKHSLPRLGRKTRFGQPGTPSWKDGLKARLEAGPSLERRAKQSARMKGTSLPDLQVVRDWKIARLAFEGKTPTEISAELGPEYAHTAQQKSRRLSLSAVATRCKRMGLPSFKAGPWLVHRGEVVTSRHLLATCEDFGIRLSELADRMGIPRPHIYRRLKHSSLDLPLPLDWARKFLVVREELKLEHLGKAPTPKGGRPRLLLRSEERVIYGQTHQLLDDLDQFRKWSENFDRRLSQQSLKSAWAWICTEHRKGKVKLLLFLGQRFFDWLWENFRGEHYLDGKTLAKLKPVAYGFLGDLHGVSRHTIDRIAWPRHKVRKPTEP